MKHKIFKFNVFMSLISLIGNDCTAKKMITFDIERCQMFFRSHIQVYRLCPWPYENGDIYRGFAIESDDRCETKIELVNFPILLSTRAHHQFSD